MRLVSLTSSPFKDHQLNAITRLSTSPNCCEQDDCFRSPLRTVYWRIIFHFNLLYTYLGKQPC